MCRLHEYSRAPLYPRIYTKPRVAISCPALKQHLSLGLGSADIEAQHGASSRTRVDEVLCIMKLIVKICRVETHLLLRNSENVCSGGEQSHGGLGRVKVRKEDGVTGGACGWGERDGVSIGKVFCRRQSGAKGDRDKKKRKVTKPVGSTRPRTYRARAYGHAGLRRARQSRRGGSGEQCADRRSRRRGPGAWCGCGIRPRLQRILDEAHTPASPLAEYRSWSRARSTPRRNACSSCRWRRSGRRVLANAIVSSRNRDLVYLGIRLHAEVDLGGPRGPLCPSVALILRIPATRRRGLNTRAAMQPPMRVTEELARRGRLFVISISFFFFGEMYCAPTHNKKSTHPKCRHLGRTKGPG